MKKRKIIIISILTVLLTLIAILFLTTISKASTTMNFPELAHKSYDNLLAYNINSFDDTSWTDGERQTCYQTMCLEKGAGETEGPLYAYAIIDINKDGNNPKKGTITYKTSSGSSTVDYTDDNMAVLAYIAAKSEVADNYYGHSWSSWDYKKSFLYVWEKCGLRYSLNNISGSSLSLPASTDTGEARYVYDDAKDYLTSLDNGTNEKTYAARIIVFKGGYDQTSAVLSGKELENAQPTIKKYITKVEFPDGTVVEYKKANGNGRSGLSEAEKEANPVVVVQGCKITYKIKLGGTGSSYTVTDTYKTQRLKYVSSGMGSDLEKKMSPGDETNVVLEAYSFYNTTNKYHNTATIKETGDSSSDYIVYRNPDIKINKYITKVVNPDGSVVEYKKANGNGRSGLSEAEKEANPVRVLQGSLITYKIKFECESTQSFTIIDAYETAGLSYKTSGLGSDLKITMKDGDTVTITLLAHKFTNTTTKYYNRAEVSGKSLYAYDYIKYKNPTLTLKKYITKVEYPHITPTQTYSRSSKTEAQKESDPVKVVQGCEITYKIVFTCDSTQKFTIKDTPNSNLVYVSGDLTKTSNGCGTTSFEVKLRAATFTNTTTKYENKVEVVGKSKYSYDYIQYRNPEIEINKYVTKVTHPNGVEQTFTRSGWNNTQKYNTAVDVVEGTIVNYTITFECESTQYFTVTDTYNTDALKFVSGTTSMSMNHGKSFTITLEAYRYINTTTKYPNTVTVSGRSETASDYVIYKELDLDKKEISGTYKKYITKHNGTAVSPNRKNYDNSTANANPLTVVQGDNVTYKLEVSNYLSSTLKSFVTVDYKITSLKIRDEYDNGLSYGSNQYFEHTFTNVNEGTTSTKSFTSNVTKSNMYLLPLENRFSPVNGKYNMTVTNTHTLNGETVIFTESYTNEDLDITKFTSNANKDYVQLDDVEIAGDVWLDNDKDGLKESGEANLSGITVKLYRNGSCVDTETTNTNGHYTFGNVAKGNKAFGTGTRKYADDSGYNEHYVEFEYFGVKYKDTVYTGATGVTDTGTTGNWNNKSHASEANVNSNNRKDFNDSLETIAYNKAYKGTTGAEASKTLEYTKSGHTSTLNWTEPTTIKAKSVNLYINAIGAEAKICTEKADHVEYLKHINLGLVERIQTDLSLKKDVVKAELNVNGYHATYNYGQLGTGSYTGTYKLQTPYVLNIYQADYKFRYDTYTDTTFKSLSDELDIKLTYKITITNESDIYSANIREIIDIYANSLTLEGNNKGLTVNTTSQYNNGTSYSYSGYTTRYLTGLNETLAPGASTTIELYYKVNKEADRSIILGEKANIAQIGAYSIYTSSGEKAGVVDQDSNPGIVNPSVISSITDDSKYEDHSYYTSIKLQIFKSGGNNYSRQIKGNVWEDLNTQTLSSGQKTGDGIKNSGETGAQNVTAVLLEVIEKGGKEYYIDTGITAKTNANGNYTLKNAEKLHAGEYVVRFVYGNNASDLKTTTGDTIRYSGQDYKSTVYTAPGNVTNENEVIEATAFKETKTAKGNKQVSIAKDNELRRLEVINYSTTMTYVKDNILKAQESDTTRKQTLAENTSMFADTKKFNIQVEKLGQTGVELPSNKVENIDGTKTYSYSVDEVNFGLLERPITKLELMDDITEVIATTASGEEILHAYFDISYKLNSTTGRVDRTVTLNEGKSIGTENVQVFNRTSSSKGFRYVNIDSELLQGMKVTIKYQFAIANIGDIDTSNENLIKIVKNRDITNVVNNLASSMPNTQVKYGTSSGLNTSLMTNYTYKNMETAVNNFKGIYGQYKTMVNGTANNKNYELGYFLGNSYYDNYEATTDKTVETRVDQIVSYIDNDLVFSPEENLSNGSPKFQTYTGADIEKNELLQGVGASNIQNVLVDSVGVSYVTDTKNNLVFNVEDETVNSGLYKFLGPLKGVTNINPVDMYVIELEASRVLASELDAIDVTIDNLAEIVKITNTSGRKAYIEFIDASTGNVISPGPSGPTGYLGNSSEIINNPDDYTVGKKEIDTNFTETVTFSPPTGLSQTQQTTRKVNTVVISILTGIVIIGTGIVTLQLIRKKKFYK